MLREDGMQTDLRRRKYARTNMNIHNTHTHDEIERDDFTGIITTWIDLDHLNPKIKIRKIRKEH